MCFALVFLYFLLGRVSKIWAYNDGRVHPEFCLTPGYLTFPQVLNKLQWADREVADTAEITSKAFDFDPKLQGPAIFRKRVHEGHVENNQEIPGVLELLLELLGLHPSLEARAPNAIQGGRVKRHHAR